MKKHELVRHLTVIHGAQIAVPHRILRSTLDEWHAEYHAKERAASDAFVAKGRKA